MARVFLSHSSRDNDAAAVLKSWLDEQGFGAPSFLDFDKYSGIPPGAEWEKRLYREIMRCQALLILQTPNWSASRWCFAEFTQARALGKPIFQVVENDAGAAEAPIATDLQRLDLRRDRPAGLEQLKRALVDIALQGQGGFPWPPPGEPDRPPFPGLMEFEEEHAAVFFGRDQEWREVIERLNGRRRLGGPRRLLVLHGSSGSGKSSLLRAGVLPRLRRAGREWLVLPPLRPKARPLQAMAQGLGVALGQAGDWRTLLQQLLASGDLPELRALLEGWAADLRVAAGSQEAQILLPIDQGEELFTVAEEQERERFLEVLAAAVSQPLPLQALMTIRADAMGSLQAVPALANTLEMLPLGPLSMDRYREIIEGPARVVGLTAESAFVERVIRDTATEDALPLLAFALKELYSKSRLGGDGRLSLNDYQALGDKAERLSPLENVVRKAANDALDPKPSEAAMKALRDAFIPAMVRVSEEGSYMRRAACWDDLPQAAHPLLEALVTARLLVRSQVEGEPSKVEVAHEALMRVWPKLRMWLEESREILTAIDQINRQYAQWKEYNKKLLSDSSEFLLKKTMLDKGKMLLRDSPSGISSELRQYIENSIDNERNRAITGAFKKTAVFLLTSIGIIGALVLIRSNPRLYANL
ncbi:MAG: toll/interleukin-1 receptor domain-containing protein, partial [Cyanobacteria bacterium]|nr:toll/interleukin-1 receptor domain-containing protein [Cyanobacteriota bacterium]